MLMDSLFRSENFSVSLSVIKNISFLHCSIFFGKLYQIVVFRYFSITLSSGLTLTNTVVVDINDPKNQLFE